MREFAAGFGLAMILAGAIAGNASEQRKAAEWPTASVRDAIQMTRIQHEASADGAVAAISPDGSHAAFVTWRGDLKRNTNVYELRLVDLRAPLQKRVPKILLTRFFPGDHLDQQASPIRQVRFVENGRALVYLGLDSKNVEQAYLFDLTSGREHQLTHHATSVRNFVVGQQGNLIAFSAVAYPKDETEDRLQKDGVFLWDPKMFPGYRPTFPASVILARRAGWNGIRQYFLAGKKPKLFFDSRRSRPSPAQDKDDPKAAVSPTQSLVDDAVLTYASMSADPSGKHLLVYPYQVTNHPLHPERYRYYRSSRMNAYARRTAPQVALVDVQTGAIKPLVDAPSPQFDRYASGPPLWSPDGRSVLLYTLFPDQPQAPPAWVQLNLASHHVVSLGLGQDWKPIGWGKGGHDLILSHKGEQFAVVHRGEDGIWKSPQTAGTVRGFNPDWPVASDGQLVLGVQDGLQQAPELAAYSPRSKKISLLTDLNPQLRQRRLGEVTAYHWRKPANSEADGFLIKPVGYRAANRYPLIILLDDGTLRKSGNPYFLDGAWQLSGHAVQMLAADGFMVLYYREPPLSDVIETPDEPHRIQQDIEAMVAKLDRQGLIDPSRIGISGWSRAGFYTCYMLIHSSIHFAAATDIDGGASDYVDRMRPFTDKELERITAPLMFESHGLWSLVYHSAMAGRMLAFGEPVEILYFETASHSTTRPQHRLRSLQTHLDWWRFWLQGHINPDPGKAAQYAHWEKLRGIRDRHQRRR